jgi:hypothetical protein
MTSEDHGESTMTTGQRAAYLRAKGWVRLGSGSSQSWRSPERGERHIRYALSAAVSEQLRRDRDGPPAAGRPVPYEPEAEAAFRRVARRGARKKARTR